MMKLFRYSLILLTILLCWSCSKFQKVTDIVTQPSSREVYAREFKDGDSLFSVWNSRLLNAKQNQLSVTLPFTLSGRFIRNEGEPLGYKVLIEKGESLIIDVLQTIDSSKVFIEMFPFENDSILAEKPIVSSEWNEQSLQYDIAVTGYYKVIIQPELKSNADFNLLIYTEPTLGFPVMGKGNSAIQSFWGASRDRGNRSHKGVDIFANRGTPVVAVTEGYVSSAGERGLGGKQVWLRSGLFGYSLYYAHLDSIAVTRGKRVKLGDTLGFVGNTGNAKTTSPHLHFGIYTNNGAVNPLPFIKMNDVPTIGNSSYNTVGVTKQRQNQLRSGPKISYNQLATLASKDTLRLLGKSQKWYHVIVADTLDGFIHQSLLTVE